MISREAFSIRLFNLGSYVDAFRHHQRRLQDEKSCRKHILSDYKNFAQNGGFGPAFGDKDYRAYKEKV